jgi:hypothetical protein
LRDNNIEIKSAGKITLDAPAIDMKAPAVLIDASGGTFEVKAASVDFNTA